MGHGSLLLSLSIVACATLAAPPVAVAQFTQGYGIAGWQRRAYEIGYRDGISGGERDARARRAYSYQDDGDFRSADEGYRRQEIDRESYRRAYRSGYADGYAAGYRRVGGYVPNTGRGRAFPRATPYPGSPGRGPYSNRYPDGRYTPRYPTAYDNGVTDGYEKGLEDARKSRSFDPLRHRWYRSGDRHYDRRFGSKDAYSAAYRRGFRAGYEEGYRTYRIW
jgi:hypothetical protein